MADMLEKCEGLKRKSSRLKETNIPKVMPDPGSDPFVI